MDDSVRFIQFTILKEKQYMTLIDRTLEYFPFFFYKTKMGSSSCAALEIHKSFNDPLADRSIGTNTLMVYI